MNFINYSTDQFYDELFENDGRPRPSASPLIEQNK